ncbi:MAG: response regulator transcription factor [Muribaculaceae bacterium]|nr:response regulator transcription factor [Muribaculaceae bacterium]MBR0023967.1 response regulator transcription factor [Muribaculaceae bacterium]
MIRCIIIDDEPLALQQMEGYIKKIPYLELVAACQSAIEAKEILENEKIDAIFCDINLPELNGLDFVKSLENPPMVVFTTAYSEYAVEGFQLNAIDYLLKPFGCEEMKRAAEKIKKRYDALRTLQEVSQIDEDDAIFLKTEYKIVRINIGQIHYVEAMSEYLRIYLEGNSRPIIVLLSMKKMEERLPRRTFMRVHRSYIINLKMIQEISKNRISLGDDTEIPIGDSYRDQFNAYINSKFLTK